MSRFLSADFANLTPYTPGEQPQPGAGAPAYIKLNTNESPYPPAPGVRRLLQDLEGLPAGELRLYSDPEALELRREIAAFYELAPENVFVGNGSDEVLAMAFLAFGRGRRVAFPDVTYAFYSVYAALFGLQTRVIPLDDNFNISPEDYTQICGDGEREAVVLANPNAITGKNLPLAALERILQSRPDDVVIIDEAYVDFGGQSAAALLPKYENLLVVQTFSKSRSLAGARVGFALGQPGLIADLNTIKYSFNPYNVNRISLAAAAEAIRDREYFQECRKKIMAAREFVSEGLAGLHFEVLPSLANFVLARHPKMGGEQIYQELKRRGILVRWFDEPRISDFVRITIGAQDDMERLLRALTDILREVNR